MIIYSYLCSYASLAAAQEHQLDEHGEQAAGAASTQQRTDASQLLQAAKVQVIQEAAHYALLVVYCVLPMRKKVRSHIRSICAEIVLR